MKLSNYFADIHEDMHTLGLLIQRGKAHKQK